MPYGSDRICLWQRSANAYLAPITRLAMQAMATCTHCKSNHLDYFYLEDMKVTHVICLECNAEWVEWNAYAVVQTWTHLKAKLDYIIVSVRRKKNDLLVEHKVRARMYPLRLYILRVLAMKPSCSNNRRSTIKCQRRCCKKQREIIPDTTYQFTLSGVKYCSCRHKTFPRTGCCQQLPGEMYFCGCDSTLQSWIPNTSNGDRFSRRQSSSGGGARPAPGEACCCTTTPFKL